MYYLSQPITGLLTKTSQLFSGRVNSLFSFSYQGDGILIGNKNGSSAIEQKSIAVRADVKQNILPSQIPFR